MYKEALRSIVGIDVFPVISLLLFVIVFAIVVLRVIRMDNADADRFAALPLDDLDRLAGLHQESCR